MSALLNELQAKYQKHEARPYANYGYLQTLKGRIAAEKMNISTHQEKHEEVATRKSQAVLNRMAGSKKHGSGRMTPGLKNAIAIADRPKVYLPLQFVV
jgi:hypothetical protein